MKKALFILTTIFCFGATAQDLSPWNTSFVVSAGGYSDTVWFGCDTGGGVGYQEGLDILDTSTFNKPLKIVMYDSIVQKELGTGTCGNLKRNIKSFKETKTRYDNNPIGGYYENSFQTEFNFYVLLDADVIDTTSRGGGLYSTLGTITWDKSEFSFENDSFEITHGMIILNNGWFINTLGQTYYDIFAPVTSGNISVLIDPIDPGCILESSKYEIISSLRLSVKNNLYSTTRFIQSIVETDNVIGKIYPNPSNGNFTIEFNDFKNAYIVISDIVGRSIYKETINDQQKSIIRLYDVLDGLYLLQVYDDESNLIGVKKILIDY